MPKYIIAYHGGNSSGSAEQSAAQRARFQTWVGDLGDAVVNPGTPLLHSRLVSTSGVSEGPGANPLIGYSILRADSLDAALAMAQGCPYLEIGTIEVAEMMEMEAP